MFQKVCTECNLSLCDCDVINNQSKTVLPSDKQNDSSFNPLLPSDNLSPSPQPHGSTDLDDNMFLENEFSNSIVSLNTNSRLNYSHSLNYHTLHAQNNIIADVPADTSMRSHASNVFNHVHDSKQSESLCESTHSQGVSSNQVTEWDRQFSTAISDSDSTSTVQISQQVLHLSNTTSGDSPGSTVQGSQQDSLSQVNEQDQNVPNNAPNLGIRGKGLELGIFMFRE